MLNDSVYDYSRALTSNLNHPDVFHILMTQLIGTKNYAKCINLSCINMKFKHKSIR